MLKINHQNRKWNPPNRIWNPPNTKWNYFSYFQNSDQKISFTKCFDLIEGVQIKFQDRKWNFPNRKSNYFSHFEASDQKTHLTNFFSSDPRGSKLIFKTGNGIIQTGNGIISPTSRPLMKKFILQNVSHLIQQVQN